MSEHLERAPYTRSRPKQKFGWELVNAVRQIGVLRIGYVGVVCIPLLSIFIVKWNSSFPVFSLNLPLHLFFLFLGSICLSLANLLSEICCPPLIKEYGRIEKYRIELARAVQDESLLVQATRQTIHSAVEKELGELSIINEKAKAVVQAAMASAHDRIETARKIRDDLFFMISQYDDVWREQNCSLPLLRWMILTAYLIATVLLAIPTIRYIWYVALAAFA